MGRNPLQYAVMSTIGQESAASSHVTHRQRDDEDQDLSLNSNPILRAIVMCCSETSPSVQCVATRMV